MEVGVGVDSGEVESTGPGLRPRSGSNLAQPDQLSIGTFVRRPSGMLARPVVHPHRPARTRIMSAYQILHISSSSLRSRNRWWVALVTEKCAAMAVAVAAPRRRNPAATCERSSGLPKLTPRIRADRYYILINAVRQSAQPRECAPTSPL